MLHCLIAVSGILAFSFLALAIWLHSLPVALCSLVVWGIAVYFERKYPPKELL
jgi:hypothetical protein